MGAAVGVLEGNIWSTVDRNVDASREAGVGDQENPVSEQRYRNFRDDGDSGFGYITFQRSIRCVSHLPLQNIAPDFDIVNLHYS